MNYNLIGFTGTRLGMTQAQQNATMDLLHQNFPLWVHLGDCIGADAQAHAICVMLGIRTAGHPPTSNETRAFCKYNKEFPAKSFLIRNHDIVDCCKLLLACPGGFREKLRSGTWATVRYARAQKKPYIIIWPDGIHDIRTDHC